jgi:hypothetical protein
MQRYRAQPHRIGRLNGNDTMAAPCEPRRIAPGSGANIEDTTGRGRDQMQYRPMRFRGGNAFIAHEKRIGFFRISLCAAHLRRCHIASPE